MKKIPTLFERQFNNHQVEKTLPRVTKGMEWVLSGEGIATVKYDGSCCAIINGVLFKRYDAKAGKKAPDGAIPCCPPDPITGHHPHWLKCDRNDPADKWFFSAFDACADLTDGTYEAIGVHFQGNPYNMNNDILVRHGADIIPKSRFTRSFDGIKEFLKDTYIEGIVFWKENEPRCKIKRSDFGFLWNPPNRSKGE